MNYKIGDRLLMHYGDSIVYEGAILSVEKETLTIQWSDLIHPVRLVSRTWVDEHCDLITDPNELLKEIL